MMAAELSGRRILVTRAAADAGRWASRLAAAGAHPVTLPCLVCETMTDSDTARQLRSAVDAADWLILASARGVRAVAQLLDATATVRGGPRLSRRVQIACVGPATARAAMEHLSRVDLLAQEPTAMGLARELVAVARSVGTAGPVHVVIAGAAGGRADVAATLRAGGIQVTQVAVYRTIPAPAAVTKRDLSIDGVEIVLLASPSAVTGLLHLATLPPSVRIITIGPTTSRAAVAAGLVVAGEAREPTFEGILEAIV